MKNKNWLVFAKHDKCHHADALCNLGFINWKEGRNFKMSIGDYVYIFVSNERRVRFKTQVVAEHCERQDGEYWINKEDIHNGPTYKLELRDEYEGHELDDAILREHGFNGTLSIQHPIYKNTKLLEYIESVFSKKSITDSERTIRSGKLYVSHGEGKEHKKLKEYIYNHPEALGIKNVRDKSMERILLSGDRLDIYFALNDGSQIAVEVKPQTSPEADIMRGLFQCVKYKAILDAETKAYRNKGDNSVVLVIGGELSKENSKISEILEVDVRPNFHLE